MCFRPRSLPGLFALDAATAPDYWHGEVEGLDRLPLRLTGCSVPPTSEAQRFNPAKVLPIPAPRRIDGLGGLTTARRQARPTVLQNTSCCLKGVCWTGENKRKPGFRFSDFFPAPGPANKAGKGRSAF